jgi:hypothetical protein
MVKQYNNEKTDLFEKRVIEWILNEEGEGKFYAGELIVNTHKEVLEMIIFNVIDAYRDLIRFPDRCPSCTRSGRDHDEECLTPDWKGKDYGIFKE